MAERIRPRSDEELEREIQKLLAKLPEELAQRWETKNDTLPLPEQRESLSQLIKRRQDAKHIVHGRDLSPGRVEVRHESPLAVRQFIERLESGNHEHVGVGKSGRVIASLRTPEVCYKVFFSLAEQPVGTNSIGLEADLQQEIADLGELHGVRAPKAYYCVENETIRAIAMERLPGVSLADIFAEEEELPAAFEINRFFSALENYIVALHECGYYHRDLHAGNVLVDRETGMPYVIDFGHATRSVSDEGVYRPHVVMSGRIVENVLLIDEQAPELLRKEVLAFKERKEKV